MIEGGNMEIDNTDQILVNLVKDSNIKHFQNRKLFGATWLNSNKVDSKWDDMNNWQIKWRKNFNRGLYFYFDINSILSNNNLKKVNNMKIATLKKKILQNNGKIEPYLNPKTVNIIITNDPMISQKINFNNNDLKFWDMNKLSRFFQNLEIDLSSYLISNDDTIKNTNSNIISYFNEKPHIYLYEINQKYRPIICKQWKVELFNKSNKENLPYPILLKDSDYGHCPFKVLTKKNINTNQNLIIKKRYIRDQVNKRYALKLRKIYQKQAKCVETSRNLINDLELQESLNQSLYNYFNHDCMNSNKLYSNLKMLQLKRFNTMDVNFKSFNEKVDPMNDLDNVLTEGSLNHENDSLSSTDTVETLHWSELSDDHETRTTLLHFTLDASLYNEQYDGLVINTGFKPTENEVKLGFNKRNYCENCNIIYKGPLIQHVNSDTHKAYASNDSNFIQIDNIIKKISAT